MTGYLLLGLFALFAAVVAIRTAAFRPRAEARPAPEAVEFDREKAVSALAELVRCRTVSYSDPALEDDGEFEKLIGKLPGLYPNVFAACTLTRLEGRGLLFRWPGKTDGDPAVLMAHYDVVPADEAAWE